MWTLWVSPGRLSFESTGRGASGSTGRSCEAGWSRLSTRRKRLIGAPGFAVRRSVSGVYPREADRRGTARRRVPRGDILGARGVPMIAEAFLLGAIAQISLLLAGLAATVF